MNIKLVGTGAIVGAERSACSLIDNKILIDCGNGILKTLTQQGIEILNIDVVLITHLHADHFFDLPFLVLLRSVSMVDNNLRVYCQVGTEKVIEHLCDDYVSGKEGSYKNWKEKGKIEFVEFDNLESVEILKDYFVTSFDVCHGDKKPAYGYVIKNFNKSVGFSGDSTYCESIDRIVKDSDVAVLDMFSVNKSSAHMTVDDIENICNCYKNKVIISTHSTIVARQEAVKRNINNLIIAVDGQEVEI